jgi:hypothetical protein
MGVIVESFSTAGFTVSGGPYTITKPAGVVDGEQLLWIVEFEDETSAPLAGPAIVTPAGWTKLGGSDNFQPYHSWAVFSRIASGEPADYAITIAAPENNDNGMIMLRLSGDDPMVPIVFGNTDATEVCPSIIATAIASAVFRGQGRGSATSLACPAGTSSVAARDQSFGGSVRVCRGPDVGVGATGTAAFDDGVGTLGHAFTLAVAALAAGHGGSAGGHPILASGRERIQRGERIQNPYHGDYYDELGRRR